MRTVYMIKNTGNGKAYIGSSCSLDGRVEKHICALRHHRHKVEDMQSDFEKYGENMFCAVPLGKFPDDEAIRMETFYQRIFRTNERAYGYNYKDRQGTSKNAIKCRWREQSGLWNRSQTQWGYLKKLLSLPISERIGYTIKQYRAEEPGQI